MAENQLEPPSWFNEHGREAWFRFIQILRRSGIYDDGLDRSMFAVLCSLYGRISETQKERKAIADSPTITDSDKKKGKAFQEIEEETVKGLQEIAPCFGFQIIWQDGVSIDLQFDLEAFDDLS